MPSYFSEPIAAPSAYTTSKLSQKLDVQLSENLMQGMSYYEEKMSANKTLTSGCSSPVPPMPVNLCVDDIDEDDFDRVDNALDIAPEPLDDSSNTLADSNKVKENVSNIIGKPPGIYDNLDIDPNEVYQSPPRKSTTTKQAGFDSELTEEISVTDDYSSSAVATFSDALTQAGCQQQGMVGSQEMMAYQSQGPPGTIDPLLYHSVLQQLLQDYPELATAPDVLTNLALQQTGLLQMYRWQAAQSAQSTQQPAALMPGGQSAGLTAVGYQSTVHTASDNQSTHWQAPQSSQSTAIEGPGNHGNSWIPGQSTALATTVNPSMAVTPTIGPMGAACQANNQLIGPESKKKYSAGPNTDAISRPPGFTPSKDLSYPGDTTINEVYEVNSNKEEHGYTPNGAVTSLHKQEKVTEALPMRDNMNFENPALPICTTSEPISEPPIIVPKSTTADPEWPSLAAAALSPTRKPYLPPPPPDTATDMTPTKVSDSGKHADFTLDFAKGHNPPIMHNSVVNYFVTSPNKQVTRSLASIDKLDEPVRAPSLPPTSTAICFNVHKQVCTGTKSESNQNQTCHITIIVLFL